MQFNPDDPDDAVDDAGSHHKPSEHSLVMYYDDTDTNWCVSKHPTATNLSWAN